MLALLFPLLISQVHALPSNEGEMPQLQSELLNFGSLTVVSKENAGDAKPSLYPVTSSWGFPVEASWQTSFALNETIKQPAHWYLIEFKKQIIPIFIMPEGKLVGPANLAHVADSTTPVDQILELAKIANGANV